MEHSTQREYIKEAFALLAKINLTVVKEHQSFLNNDITPKQLMLLRTIKDEERITINHLSEKLFLSPSSTSQLLNRLEKEKYVKREINLHNRREIFVTLDVKGISLFEQYEKIDEFIIERYYSEFTFEEVKMFRDLVRKLYNTIQTKAGE